jgi:hypothetical protein
MTSGIEFFFFTKKDQRQREISAIFLSLFLKVKHLIEEFIVLIESRHNIENNDISARRDYLFLAEK